MFRISIVVAVAVLGVAINLWVQKQAFLQGRPASVVSVSLYADSVDGPDGALALRLEYFAWKAATNVMVDSGLTPGRWSLAVRRIPALGGAEVAISVLAADREGARIAAEVLGARFRDELERVMEPSLSTARALSAIVREEQAHADSLGSAELQTLGGQLWKAAESSSEIYVMAWETLALSGLNISMGSPSITESLDAMQGWGPDLLVSGVFGIAAGLMLVGLLDPLMTRKSSGGRAVV